jgi:hypothetical protein
MRKLITFLMTLLVGSSVSYANADFGQLTFEAGYRHDEISSKLKASSHKNKLHRKFDNLDIFQIGLTGRTMLGCNFYGRASANWGWIIDGDYKRTFSSSQIPAIPGFSDVSDFVVSDRNRNLIDDNSFVYDANIAVGYPFFFSDCTLALSPTIGYAVNVQRLTVADAGIASDAVACCKNRFHYRWYGPFVGVDFTYRPAGECWNLHAGAEYHIARLRSKFDQGATDGFLESTSRRAHGWAFEVGADYDFSSDWTAGLSLKVQDWRASKRHSHYGYDSSSDSSSSSDRAKAHNKWNSYAINLTLGKQF